MRWANNMLERGRLNGAGQKLKKSVSDSVHAYVPVYVSHPPHSLAHQKHSTCILHLSTTRTHGLERLGGHACAEEVVGVTGRRGKRHEVDGR